MSEPKIRKIPREPSLGESIVKACELELGDLVELEGTGFFSDDPKTEHEYGEVAEVEPEPESSGRWVVEFSNFGAVGCHPDQPFIVDKY